MFDDVKVIPSKEGNVQKYVFTSPSGVFEAVLYRYPDYETRTVICCSTMSGCPVGCRFCGAGDHFVRSASAAEIVAQVKRCIDDTGLEAWEIDRLQIMFMSMGEPLLNNHSLSDAIVDLHEMYPRAALLVSTIGPRIDYKKIQRLSVEVPTLGLQFSVHETTDDARNALIPFKGKLSLAEIATEGWRWHEVTGRKPFFNYCAGAHNTTDADAKRLHALFDPNIWCATVSVICERNEGMPARNDHQVALAKDFANRLLGEGFDVRVFDPAGQDDIGGGCGQLWFVQQWMKDNPQLARPTIGHGRPSVHVPAPAELQSGVDRPENAGKSTETEA